MPLLKPLWPGFRSLVVGVVLLASGIGSLLAREPAAVITVDALEGYANDPADVQAIITRALALSALGLDYTYGSADPAKGGMDCSGTIHHLLTAHGLGPVPRQADGFYTWAWKAGTFHAVNSPKFGGFEFANLRPGDLLFWSGTYDIKRDPPVTHVMLYLGRLKEGGRPVMFGASDDRPWQNERRSGVGVFDFLMPRPGGGARFLGYAAIPGLTNQTEGNKGNKAEPDKSEPPGVPTPPAN